MKRKFDTILLAFSLFCISGAMLFYNFRAAEGLSVSPSPGALSGEFASDAIAVSARARSSSDFDESEACDTAEADTDSQDSDEPETEAALLPPIIRALDA